MRAIAKGDMLRVELPRDVELIRILEVARIAVRGGVLETHHLTFLDDLAVHLYIARRRPEHVVEGRHPADDLFACVLDELAIVEVLIKKLVLIGMARELFETAGDRASGRLGATDVEERMLEKKLILIKLFALELRTEPAVQEIVAIWILRRELEHLLVVHAELTVRLVDLLGHILGAHAALEEAIDPAKDEVMLLYRNTEHGSDDAHRQARGEIADDLHPPAWKLRLDKFDGPLADARLLFTDVLRGEALRDNPALLPM